MNVQELSTTLYQEQAELAGHIRNEFVMLKFVRFGEQVWVGSSALYHVDIARIANQNNSAERLPAVEDAGSLIIFALAMSLIQIGGDSTTLHYTEDKTQRNRTLEILNKMFIASSVKLKEIRL